MVWQLMEKLKSILGEAASLLASARVDSPRLSAEVLLAHCLGLERNDLLKLLIMEPQKVLEPQILARFSALCARRGQGEPVAYLVGSKEFFGREFGLCKHTLVPRPETELLVEKALEAMRNYNGLAPHQGVFADFGTGSGCIAITLVLEMPDWQGIALDISQEALEQARCNARELGIGGAGAVHFVRASFHCPPLPDRCLNLLVSNPPYVSLQEYREISHEVREFEPHTALVPASEAEPQAARCDGFADIAVIIVQAERLLKPGGMLLFEMGHSQGVQALQILEHRGWRNAAVYADLAGLPRVVCAEVPANPL